MHKIGDTDSISDRMQTGYCHVIEVPAGRDFDRRSTTPIH
jgi:hypothetical protein